MNKTWGRAAAMLTVGALMLSGCGGDDEPTATPTPSGSASSSASASPSSSGSGSMSPSATATPSSTPAADVPAAARARTEAGAIAFLKFYFDQINKGLLDPPNAPDLFAIADKDCVACKNGQDLFAQYAKGGWSLKRSGIQIADAALANPVTSPSVIVNFTFVEAEQPLFQNGQPTKNKVPAAKTKKGAALKWVNNAWQMYGIENL